MIQELVVSNWYCQPTKCNGNKFEDVLVRHNKFRAMVNFVEKTYPKIFDKVFVKQLNITRYEINSLQYTARQFKDLKQFCANHNYHNY